MPPKAGTPAKGSNAEYQAIAAQWAKAKKAKEAEDAAKQQQAAQPTGVEAERAALERKRKASFEGRALWTVAFWIWMLCIHAIGILLFTSGFLLTRLVLEERSECARPPSQPLGSWPGAGTVEGGCWHPRTFRKAVVVIIDALRYDFTIPVEDASQAEIYHNALPFLHETAVTSPQHAVLLPFIADPPTSTLQRLRGLTTGTLPTFIDIGSNFAGTAVEEDNLLMQFREQGQRMVHLGDDTWTALFPDYFEPNISRAYDSLNVWDLHTVDNGVIDHIFPLLKPEQSGKWDVMFGHLLGVDHAGHRYGPNHAAMRSKLQQMDGFVRDLAKAIDDDTLLVVMGDHGMDGKGDHGGESDDEVQAALWMYSKKPVFGRTSVEHSKPPPNAKVRPVNQIDLVPTLALLMGIPVPYNNLGRPIEEAFIGAQGKAWDRLAAASSVVASGIRRYQASYFEARGIEQTTQTGSPADLFAQAEKLVAEGGKTPNWDALHRAFTNYQTETLSICKDLWARFDVPKMLLGVVIMAFGVGVLLLYVSRDEDEDFAILDDVDLDSAEKSLELQGAGTDVASVSYKSVNRHLVTAGGISGVLGLLLGFAGVSFTGSQDWVLVAAIAALSSMVSVTVRLLGIGKSLRNLLPNTYWGWLAVGFTLSQSIGFAANSYTIWEDSISLFFLATFGFSAMIAALRLPTRGERTLAIYHSVVFIILSRAASFSKLCREEQMPYCTSTFYASANSTTSATWQLAIPFAVMLILPSVIRGYLMPSRSYEGLAPAWIGYIFRGGLFLSAVYWTLDAAENGDWFPSLEEGALQNIRIFIAQVILALTLVAGFVAFGWAPPSISIRTHASGGRTAQVTVLGYGNVHGSRYLLLPINICGALVLLTKPMGSGAIAIMLWQVLSLLDILDIQGITAEAIGPVVLALLGNFHFFKTGHQATLSSIQWDTAFIPLTTIRYPWTPMVVALNTFAGPVLACVAVPLLVLWKTGPKRKGVIESASRVLGIFIAYYAVETLATMAWAGHLRRHLMLYRVFNPRFMMAAAVLLVVDVVGIAVALLGVRTNILAVSEVFGFAD
ncbi:GPI ethanolamine phosphate transferase [Microdochium trichocladiopsis]|uniref:GPI ethanolamine phosphate transferase n=1 Tax=Microdochium trichocladiopsis TaxID=1682393 RepID=A0A9P8YF36_9PEZI|nr:GPI ethanolamine phosphate transferase [Microdochium trichocladiopsis]KAH7037727.1 GPI ethanolamine phosphate transferase [Microdochium trichocladiopsis]